VCYVETKSLDGETNLKQRRAVKEARGRVAPRDAAGGAFDCGGLAGAVVEMEHPNDVIAKFEGTIAFAAAGGSPPEKAAVNLDFVYMRGTTVRSVDWVLGVAVNTGPDTKIMKSNKDPPMKESSLILAINRVLKYIIGLLTMICLTGGLCSYLWMSSNAGEDAWYLGYPRADAIWGAADRRASQARVVNLEEAWFIKFFYYFLLMAQFVPVSLYVSMSMTKNFQARFLEWDLGMYHEASDTPCAVKSMALNEELGQISHVFSDKTGTLTCNVMDFRKCAVGGRSYGEGITAIGAASLARLGEPIPAAALEANELARASSQPHVTFHDPRLAEDLAAPGPQRDRLVEFFRLLAVCHTVLPGPRGPRKTRFSASSPDDEALVCGAKYFGLSFESRTTGLMTLRNAAVPGVVEEETYEVVELLDFNSDRKRMSVICRRVVGGEPRGVVIYTKGADTVMESRLRAGQEAMVKATFEAMVGFSSEGLRTLVCGRADLPGPAFEAWLTRYRAATSDLGEIQKRQNFLPNAIDDLMDEAETAFGDGLELLGATAIEDRLQDGVPETVHKMLDAGIKVWVLTGDKQETAINIGVACQLIEPTETMEQIIARAASICDISLGLGSGGRRTADAAEPAGGAPGDTPAPPAIPPCRAALLQLARHCKAVVGCRVSPIQKRQMVELVRFGGRHASDPGAAAAAATRTLAIGDGANDVPMIQGAHVGVGISGQEGMQAVNNSDYAIAQFAFLQRLLLVHGRWNYRRTSKLVCHIFYKNVLQAMLTFWYASLNQMSGTKNVVEYAASTVFYTAWPVILLGTFDQDVSAETALANPALYRAGPRDEFFTRPIF
ncbi:hypothetical protein AURANDRAFT_22034, partial [Aureococcus anophagefferens]